MVLERKLAKRTLVKKFTLVLECLIPEVSYLLAVPIVIGISTAYSPVVLVAVYHFCSASFIP